MFFYYYYYFFWTLISNCKSIPCSFPSPFEVADEGTSSFGLQFFALANHKVLESIAFVWQVIHISQGDLGRGAAFRNAHTSRGASFSTQRLRQAHPILEEPRTTRQFWCLHVFAVIFVHIWSSSRPASYGHRDLGISTAVPIEDRGRRIHNTLSYLVIMR